MNQVVKKRLRNRSNWHLRGPTDHCLRATVLYVARTAFNMASQREPKVKQLLTLNEGVDRVKEMPAPERKPTAKKSRRKYHKDGAPTERELIDLTSAFPVVVRKTILKYTRTLVKREPSPV